LYSQNKSLENKQIRRQKKPREKSFTKYKKIVKNRIRKKFVQRNQIIKRKRKKKN